MSKIKARYVATVAIDVEYPRLRNTLPIDEIDYRMRNDATKLFKKLIQEYMVPDAIGTVDITEKYIDVYETEGAE